MPMAAPDIIDDPADLSSSTLDARQDRDKEKDRNKSSKSPSSKSKDLSHVPCKFFRVGSCTAGASCPFSHQVQQPGQQKDVCAWFVKGNCKFGHKCALAHILPGQSSAMDRRNKKAAQLAAQTVAGTGPGGGVPRERERERERDSRGRKSGSTASGQSAGRSGPPSRSNTLLSGSTAPTRVLPTSARPPLPISISKAAPAPAETAPALHDADFTSRDAFSRPNEQGENGVDTREAHAGDITKENVDDKPTNGATSPKPPADSGPFPVSTPSRPHRFTGRHSSSHSVDFGPVGSPPRASPSAANSNPIRINGFSPGTSPRDPVQVTQPLAAAGSTFSSSGGGTNLFMNPSSPRGAGSGLAASLSLGTSQVPPHTQPFAVGSLPILSRPIGNSQSYAEALDDEDMEELVPSSLKDLLTPEEQSRRMSRTSSSQAPGAGITGGPAGIATPVSRAGVHREDGGHRHSRSVPSASLLSQNLRSIWSDAGGELGQENVGFGLSPAAGGAGPLGASPSFAPSPGLHAFDNNDGPSPSMLSPSNASAAFLGLHQYMGPSRVPGGISAVRAVSQGNVHHHTGLASTVTAGNSALNPSASSSFDTLTNRTQGAGLSSSPSHLPRAPFDPYPSSSPTKYTHHALSPHRPVPAAPSAAFRAAAPEQALSPGARALQAHVPGQSLPQGLAAGFSRIHLQPPSSAAFSPGSQHGSDVVSGPGANGSGMEWMSATPTYQHHFEHSAGPVVVGASAMSPPVSSGAPTPEQSSAIATNTVDPDIGGLTSMFSHLSYSSVAAGSLRGHPGPGAAAVPTSVSRRSSARGWSSHPLSSPLSGPVLTNDDDELFSMDEEK